jgi:N-acetylglutamate synthase-like GNAT family acetyltransferase
VSPANLGTRIVTRSGCLFWVRPARPTDATGLAEFFAHVTPEDMRFRFLTGLKEIGSERLAAMVNVDHRQTENFLALVDNGTKIIATAMLACDADLSRGEVAIAVRSDSKHDGVSWELLNHITAYAESIGVKTLESVESRDNYAAIELEREMGFTATSYPGDATLVLVQRTLGQG